MNKIISEIEKQIWNAVPTENRIGILDGLSGMVLFYNYLIEIDDKEEYQDKLMFVITRINDLLSENEPVFTFCSGMSGYGWALLKMKNKNIAIDEEYYQSIDSILLDVLQKDSDENYYDFMHGALGTAMYFIERYKLTKDKNIENILIAFSTNLIQKINTDINTLLTTFDENQNEKYYYFGLAHGTSGFLNFLIHLKTELKEVILNIDESLIKIIDFMNGFKKYDSESKQFYPAQFRIDTNTISSARLGWCQGDLGIGNALYNSGLFLNDKKLQEEGIELINTTQLISVNESRVNDFALCHGSSGLILQYHLASKKLNKNYSETITIWYENLKKQTHDFVNFKSFFIDKYVDETNILNGSAGLGLLLLTLENKIDIDWVECLNLY